MDRGVSRDQRNENGHEGKMSRRPSKRRATWRKTHKEVGGRKKTIRTKVVASEESTQARETEGRAEERQREKQGLEAQADSKARRERGTKKTQ